MFAESFRNGAAKALMAGIGMLSTLPTADAPAQPREFKFQRVTVEAGLSQCTVIPIFQDRRGFMWFGTADGLNRYDGYGFKYYKHDPGNSNSLSHSNITAIAEDRQGMLWFGTSEAGLNKFDRKSGTFMHYRYVPADSSSLSSDQIRNLLFDALGVLWIGTPNAGLNAFDPGTEKFIRYEHDPQNPQSLSHNYIRGLYEDRAGTLWVIANQTLHKFDHRTGSFKRYALALSKKSKTQDEAIAFYEDRRGTFWLGTYHSGLMIFDREKERVTHQFQHDPRDSTSLLDNEVVAICEDVAGALWLGNRGGVSRYDPATGKFLRFRHDPKNSASISFGNCKGVYRDRSDLMWFATDGSGLSKLDPRPPKFAHLKHEVGNRNSLSLGLPKAIWEDRKGDLWIGMISSGVSRVNRRSGEITRYSHNPADPRTLNATDVVAIYEDREGILWLGSQGLNRFDREHETFAHPRNDEGRRLGLPQHTADAICQDQEGKIWVGGNALSMYDKKTLQTITYEHRVDDPTSLSSIPVTVVYEDRQGILWVGTQNGLNKFNRARQNFTHYFSEPSNPNSLSNDYIKSIFEDRDSNLWIGTSDGLNRLDPERKTFTRYHAKEGLPNTFIYGILGDDHGNLWLSTNGGISKLDPATGTFRNYALKDGLQSREFNTGAYHRSKRTGEMFFGGINGINIFHPDSVKDSSFLPAIVLTDFKKFDLPVKLDIDIANATKLKLDYEENVFSFEFAALDYTHPEKNQYAYMLEGFDKDWVYCGDRRFARYTNLNPGNYTFRVKGTNHDGVWNPQGAALSIAIVPPFWMTWWFKILTVAATLAAVAGAAKYVSVRKFQQRLEAIERQQTLSRERERISKDMHDELGANLTKIAILGELAQQNLANPQKLRSDLQKISATARATIDSMSEIIWAINPKNNSLDNLAAYLRKCAADCFELAAINYRLHFPEAVPGHPISAEFRRHVFLVVKEAIHNVVKHARATEAEVQLISCDHTLEISIRDNGQGFVPETVNGCGNGLRNMSKRMADVGGEFEIQSQPQEGTRVRILARIKS